MRRTFKALAALAAVVALLTVNASPSSAQTGTVTAGTITVNLTPVITEPLASTTGSCGNTFDVSFTTSLTSGTSTLNIKGHFAYSGGNYLLELTGTFHVNSTQVSTTSYNLTAGASTGTTGITVTDVNIYTSTGADSCTRSSTTPKCANIDVAFPLITGNLAGSVTTVGTVHTADAGGVASINTFVGNIAAAGCTPPFSALNGKTATVAGMQVTF